MLEGYRSPFDATVVARLAEAGCVTLGKLNCDEFAMGDGNETPPCPVGWTAPAAAQPLGHRRACPAAPPAAAPLPWRPVWRPAATGTDTGGSIRQPACVLRHHRHQAHLWPRQPLRHDRLRLQPGPGRPHGRTAPRTARCCCARCAAPTWTATPPASTCPAEDFTREAERQHRRPAHRRARRVLWRRPGRRRARRRAMPR